MDVIVQAGGRFHSYHIARAANRAGYLKKFITTRHISYETGIEPNLMQHIPILDYLGYAWHRSPLEKIVQHGLFKDPLFDLLARQHVTRCDIFHGFLAYSLFSMRKAKSLGAVTIVETGSIHILAQKQLVEEEYEAFGQKLKPMNRLWVEKQLQEYEEANYISVASSLARESFIQRGFDPKRILHIRYGADVERFQRITSLKRDSVFRVIYVGAISLQKGVPYLLEAVSSLRRKDFELLLVGRVQHDMKDIMRKYSGSYLHIPSMRQPDLQQIYNRGSVFVLPSVQDGFGMVVTEAMACGLPIVVSENAGARDVVRHGVSGFVVPARTPTAIKDALLFLYENPKQRQEMADAAYKGVQQYTWEDYGKRWVAQWESLLRESR